MLLLNHWKLKSMDILGFFPFSLSLFLSRIF
jgi:hypothetical protein